MRWMVAAGVAVALLAAGCTAEEGPPPIRIGLLTALTGTQQAPGSDIRQGFLLYLEPHDNTLGGREVERTTDRVGQRGTARFAGTARSGAFPSGEPVRTPCDESQRPGDQWRRTGTDRCQRQPAQSWCSRNCGGVPARSSPPCSSQRRVSVRARAISLAAAE